MDAITNAADVEQQWVRAFVLRLGYHLAAEYQFMPACDLKDIVGDFSNTLIDMADVDPEPEPPELRLVTD